MELANVLISRDFSFSPERWDFANNVFGEYNFQRVVKEDGKVEPEFADAEEGE